MEISTKQYLGCHRNSITKGWRAVLKIAAGLVIVGFPAGSINGADGPKNSLALRFDTFDPTRPTEVRANLQGYRDELTEAAQGLQSDNLPLKAETLRTWLEQAVHLNAAGAPCTVVDLQGSETKSRAETHSQIATNSQIETESRITGGLVVWLCQKATKHVQVTLANSNSLPTGFTVSVSGASGHQALSWMNAEGGLWTDTVIAEVLAGWQWVTGGDIPRTLGLGRQGPVWFGGLGRLSWGYGSLLLVALVLISKQSNRFKIVTLGLGSVAAWLTGRLILSNGATQGFFGLVYTTHLYFVLIAVLGAAVLHSALKAVAVNSTSVSNAAGFVDSRKTIFWVLGWSMVWLTLGVELAFMAWSLSGHSETFFAINSYDRVAVGVLTPNILALAVLAAIPAVAQRLGNTLPSRRLALYRMGQLFIITITAGIVALSIYSVVALTLRLQF